MGVELFKSMLSDIPFPWNQFKLSDLPHSMYELADLISLDNVLRLLVIYHGKRLYIPLKVNPPRKERGDRAHWLVEAVGEKAAELISREFGGDYLRFPYCTFTLNRYRVLALRNERTISEVARSEGMSVAGVMRILKTA